MNKELEALLEIHHVICVLQNEINQKEQLLGSNTTFDVLEQINKDVELLKKTLQRLESIDNANPSEALECLERLEYYHIRSVNDLGCKEHRLKDINTIKQALLKAQEPKNYLKWEDLEFKEDNEAKIKVRMGEHIYDLWYGSYKTGYGTFKQKCSLSGYEFDEDYDIDFFNDLHLERVEE